MENILHSKIIGKGKPLLILHGFLGSGDNWISLGRKFSENFELGFYLKTLQGKKVIVAGDSSCG